MSAARVASDDEVVVAATGRAAYDAAADAHDDYFGTSSSDDDDASVTSAPVPAAAAAAAASGKAEAKVDVISVFNTADVAYEDIQDAVAATLAKVPTDHDVQFACLEASKALHIVRTTTSHAVVSVASIEALLRGATMLVNVHDINDGGREVADLALAQGVQYMPHLVSSALYAFTPKLRGPQTPRTKTLSNSVSRLRRRRH